SAFINVSNAPPFIQALFPASVNEGQSFNLDLTAIDAGADTASQWTVDWGDGSPVSVSTDAHAILPHVYADGPHGYAMTITATDEDGAYTKLPKPSISVNNVPPTLTLTGPDSLTTAQPYSLMLSATEVGPDTITQWMINWGDGSAVQ